jgi:hypothetical protein
MKSQQRYFLITLFAFYAAAVSAQVSPANNSFQNKQIIEEVIHTFSVQKLTPELTLSGQSASNLSAGTPEKTVQAWLLAMKQSTYSEVMSFWDAAAREKSRALDQRANKSNAQSEREWKSLMSNSSAVITNRITYGNYVLLTLEIRDQSKATIMKETLALQNNEGAWKLTYDLVDSVVFNKWDSDEKRIQRLANPLYKRIQSK